MTDRTPRIWTFEGTVYGGKRQEPLVAFWEPDGSAMSDNYSPDEITAQELLYKWAATAEQRYPDKVVPILWVVDSAQGAFKIEYMPFQNPWWIGPDPSLHKDFLTYYTWPVDAQTGELLNWLTLPVVDKQWNEKRDDTGGFIQETTGWKPSVLQPSVYLPSLTDAARWGRARRRRTKKRAR